MNCELLESIHERHALFILFIWACVVATESFNSGLSSIRHFEKLSYDVSGVDKGRGRLKRSLFDDKIELKFKAYGRDFHLLLWKDDNAAVGRHSTIDVNGRPVGSLDLSYLYSGKLKDDPQSQVFGSIIDGVFDGQIRTGDGDVYYVEKSLKYFDSSTLSRFHSIVYTEKDIDEDKVRPKRRLNVQSHAGCGFDGRTREWMEHFQSSSVEDHQQSVKKVMEKDLFYHSSDESPAIKWLDPTNFDRYKRQSNGEEPDSETGLYRVRTCSLYVQSDQKLYEHIFTHEGQRSEKRTQEEIIALINNHIKAVNSIYENTNFDGLQGFNFIVQRVTIYDSKSCRNESRDDPETGNPFCEENVDVSNYLNRNSIRNHSDFCLAYALTFRDFDGGTLGLAWVASPQASIRGGICEVYQQYTEGSKHVKRSLNTGIITLVNYNNRVPPKVSQLTLAHEIGHNFGSPHDFPSACVPGLPDGNFIMFASATAGDKPNNAKFSMCSIRNISSVLRSVLSNKPTQTSLNLYGAKRNCFTARKGPFCGNQIVEEGEECDCGFDDQECAHRLDKCCNSRSPNNGEARCTLKSIVTTKFDIRSCSPSQGPCCSENCEMHSRDANIPCRAESECTKAQTCDGKSSQCPPSQPKDNSDGSPLTCADNTKICKTGSCNGSICEVLGPGWEECFLTSNDNVVKCHLACMKPGGDPKKDCISSFDMKDLEPYYQEATKENGKPQGILLRPGSPCNNFVGYCDVFYKCRSVDSNGPLSRLKDLFSPEALDSVAVWVQRYWWGVVLMGIGLVLTMALFIKCCAVHTPSSNPRKPPAQSIYETLRHPTTLVRGQGRSHSRPSNGAAGGGQNRRPRSRSRRADMDANGLSSAPLEQSHNREQPPPYSAVVVEASRDDPAIVGPARGHRKHKNRRPHDRSAGHVEMRTRRV